ncbi:hypothetical protein [Haloferula sp. BvORR071]|uniref:hypothetical protein n=1 Tax=Haloferula sp. BvORR071 TaxID=1396141 RepID=UPI0005526745|nr:hypothetical protein [Haloferula sp. BvORR071]
MPVICLTLEWLAACLWLGHAPDPKLHRPMAISGLSSILHGLTLLAVTAFLPTSIGVTIAAFMAWGNRPRAWRTLGAIAFLTTGSAAIWIANPFDAVHWWLA